MKIIKFKRKLSLIIAALMCFSFLAVNPLTAMADTTPLPMPQATDSAQIIIVGDMAYAGYDLPTVLAMVSNAAQNGILDTTVYFASTSNASNCGVYSWSTGTGLVATGSNLVTGTHATGATRYQAVQDWIDAHVHYVFDKTTRTITAVDGTTAPDLHTGTGTGTVTAVTPITNANAHATIDTIDFNTGLNMAGVGLWYIVVEPDVSLYTTQQTWPTAIAIKISDGQIIGAVKTTIGGTIQYRAMYTTDPSATNLTILEVQG